MQHLLSNFSIVQPVQAQTQEWTAINQSCVVNGVASIQGIGCLLANVLSVALTILGIVGFVMIIYSGLSLMLSAGNSQAMEKSSKTLTFAVIGIVLALSSFIILNLISAFTGIDIIKQFSIPGSETQWF